MACRPGVTDKGCSSIAVSTSDTRMYILWLNMFAEALAVANYCILYTEVPFTIETVAPLVQTSLF